jgi:2,4-diaminopentanoate dehydrogenase
VRNGDVSDIQDAIEAGTGPEPAGQREVVPVLCYGLGPIGLAIADVLCDRGAVTVTGAVDIDPAKTGADLGTLLARPTPIVTIAAEPGQAEPGAVAVHATGSQLADVEPQLAGLLADGWNVLSTCEQLVYPQATDPAIAERLHAAALRHGRTLLGSGINPGFLLDALVLVLTGACTIVRSVQVRRVVDTNARRIPLQLKAGVGLTPAEFSARAAAGRIGHVGLRQSALMVAGRLGWRVQDYTERIEPVIAPMPVQTGLGLIPAGSVIGQRQRAAVVSSGRDVLRYDLQMSAGAAATDSIEIDGDPPIRQHITGGINGDIGTAAVIANLVPVVAAARPGLLTMADILPLAGVTGVAPRAGTAGAPGVAPRAGTAGAPGVAPRAGTAGAPGIAPRANTAGVAAAGT